MKKLRTSGLFLALILILSVFSGCGSGKGEDEVPTISKDNAYRAKKIAIPEEAGTPAKIIFEDDSIILFSGAEVVYLGLDGDVKNTVNLTEKSETGKFVSFDSDSAGGLWAAEYPAISSAENDPTAVIGIVNFSGDGSVTKRIELDASGLIQNDPYFSIVDFMVDPSGNMYIRSKNNVHVFDAEGKPIYEVTGAAERMSLLISMFKMPDGRVAGNYWEFETTDGNFVQYMMVKIIDSSAKKEENFKVLSDGQNFFRPGTSGNKVIMSTGAGLFTYDLDTQEQRELFNFIHNGVNSMGLIEYRVLPDGSVLCASGINDSEAETGVELYLYEKLDPSEVPDTKVISVSTLNLDEALRRAVVDFNKDNLEYRAEIKSFLTGDTLEAMSDFNMELISGNIPDVVVFGMGMQTANYVKKGILADLYEYMENDPGFNKGDYLPNILKATETDGKLHRIVPRFVLTTLSVKSSLLEDKKHGWTYDEFETFIDSHPESPDKIMYHDKKRFVLEIAINQFFDPETGMYEFDREKFKRILKIADKFPAEETAPGTDLSVLSSGNPLMAMTFSLDFTLTKYYENMYFGEELMLKGYPDDTGGSGIYLQPIFEMAISEKAKNKDGAWEFLKHTLNYEDEFTRGLGFPIKISQLEDLAEESKQKSTYTDDNGEEVEIDDPSYPVNTDADVRKIMDLIDSAEQIYQFDNQIISIINEETGAYFAGQKTADDIISIIEERVNLYIAEMG